MYDLFTVEFIRNDPDYHWGAVLSQKYVFFYAVNAREQMQQIGWSLVTIVIMERYKSMIFWPED